MTEQILNSVTMLSVRLLTALNQGCDVDESGRSSAMGCLNQDILRAGSRPEYRRYRTGMNPVFNTTGYRFEEGGLRLLQKQGWILIDLADIAEVKKPSLASAVVRFSDGKTKDLDLSQLSVSAFSEVGAALDAAARAHRTAATKMGLIQVKRNAPRAGRTD